MLPRTWNLQFSLEDYTIEKSPIKPYTIDISKGSLPGKAVNLVCNITLSNNTSVRRLS